MKPPSVSNSQLKSFTNYIHNTGIRRDLSRESSQGFISTKCLPFDFLTGCNGIPRGRITEISGPESSGKSTLALYIANCELETNSEGVVLYLDYERSTAKKYAEKIGVLRFKERFELLDPDSLEQANETISGLCKEHLYPSLVIVDSLAAMQPLEMLDRNMDDSPQIGLQARKLSELLGRWVKYGADYGITFILLNQLRSYIPKSQWDKPKGIPGIPGSDKEIPAGGWAPRFYASLRIRLAIQNLVMAEVNNPMTGEKEKVPIASYVKGVAFKNKVDNPYRSGCFYIEFGKGVDNIRTMLFFAENRKLLEKKGGGYYTLKLPSGRKLEARGENKVLDLLRGDEQAQKELIKVLQWEEAEKVVEEVIGTTSIIMESQSQVDLIKVENPLETEEVMIQQLVSEGLNKKMVSQLPTLLAKAQILEVIKNPIGEEVIYVNDLTGEEKKGKNLEVLKKQLDESDLKLIQEQVEKRLIILEKIENVNSVS